MADRTIPDDSEGIKQVYDWGAEQFVKNLETDAPVLLTFQGEEHVVKLTELERFLNKPVRKKGDLALADVDSFAEYVNTHKADGTILVGSYHTTDTVATLNHHAKGEGSTGWSDHKATLRLVKSPEWIAWREHDGKTFSQSEFADFIEDQSHIVEEPSPARLIEIALNLRIKKDVLFDSKINIQNGSVTLAYTEDVQNQTKHTLVIPDSFTIALRPFRGAGVVQMLVRLRFRVGSDGKATFFFKLDRPDRVLEEALDDIWAGVEKATALKVLRAP